MYDEFTLGRLCKICLTAGPGAIHIVELFPQVPFSPGWNWNAG